LCIGHTKLYGIGTQTHMHTHKYIIIVIIWSRQSDDSVAQPIQSNPTILQNKQLPPIKSKTRQGKAINEHVIKVTRVCTLLPSVDLSRSSSRNRSRSRYSKLLIPRPKSTISLDTSTSRRSKCNKQQKSGKRKEKTCEL